jgi:hypothetical protein
MAFIRSKIADHLLKLGYKVRGTTKTLPKNAWVTKLLDSKYSPRNFEFPVIANITVNSASDEAIIG